MKLKTEAELIQGVKDGDEQAAMDLYNKLYNKVYRVSLKHARSAWMAEDAAQHALTNAFLRINTFNGTAAFSTWVITIARRYLIDQYRRLKVIRKHTTPALAKFHVDRHEEIDAQERIDVAMNQLPRPHVDLLNMVCFEKYTYREAAEVYGVPVGTIRSRLNHYRNALRKKLAL